jgi:adenine-specific DNA-methyltransferase
MRPDVGTQAQFKKKMKPTQYRYDSSLSPALDWDENPAREQGEALIRQILDADLIEEAKAAAEKLKAMSHPFLNWSGKAERLSFDVPTLPLFVHERLSTEAILETVKSHQSEKQIALFDIFGDPHRSITDQVLRPYEQGDWSNRMILGDSLVVMNSLLRYESLGGQVQMIYIDPPYGVKFGSNFQPFVRKRDVKHGDDDEMTREPEMVQAYRDTWELGLHSYLTYLRDRFLLARDLLHPSGSIFVQISDENVHHVREVMDEVFGAENFVSQIAFQTTSGFKTKTIARLGDYLLWYARNIEQVKVRKQFEEQKVILGEGNARWVLLPDGTYRGVSAAEKRGEVALDEGARLYKPDNLLSQGGAKEPQPFIYGGKPYEPSNNSHWKANYPVGMNRLAQAGRIHVAKNSIQYRRFADDFPYEEIGNIWTDTLTGSFTDEKVYVVQTNVKVVQRCILMTTGPGDLVLDPTCGSGTTAYVAEQWGRRWITIDTSRVPLALARQRLLTATFPYHELEDESRGPIGGFVYKRKQNNKGEEVGGIVPHITLESIANNEPPAEEVLVDRPEEIKNITRVTAPFTFEATIPTPVDWEGDGEEDSGTAESYGSFVDRMLEVLRRSPVLRLDGNRAVTFKNIRPPTKTLTLSAEALVDASANGQAPTLADVVQEAAEKNANLLPLSAKPVAFVFGSENGAVSEKLVFEAAKEASAKSYTHLYVIGFAIQPNARELVENCEAIAGIPATYVQATPDLLMGDLLKHMRSSQIFSVAGLPDIKIHVKTEKDAKQYQVELMGLDIFDPVTMEVDHRRGDDVPAWFLDTDYNNLCFRIHQAFFPRTSAWDNLKKALKADYEASVWEHLAGTTSAPFEAGENQQIAVKVIDDRGNELLVVKSLKEAE